MGDSDLGLYVDKAVADAICAYLVPRANIVTPNHFEAQYLLNDNNADAVKCSLKLLRNEVGVAVVSGQVGAAANDVSTFASSITETRCVTTPKVDVRPTGTGDVLAAAFLAEWLASKSIASALEGAIEVVYRLLEQCQYSGQTEMTPELCNTPVATRPCTHSAPLIDRAARKILAE